MKKTVSRIGVFSFAKVYCIITAIFGFIVGVILSIAAFYNGFQYGWEVFSFIIAPILYGIMGFIIGAFSAWLYNIVAKKVGGVEVEFK